MSLKTILIVEDIELNIDLLVQLLEDNYKLLIARGGMEALRMIQNTNLDLVLMDISLPEIDGYDVTGRARETLPTLPIIGLSAHAMQGDREKAIKAGFTDYLTKPIDETLLFEKLGQYLG